MQPGIKQRNFQFYLHLFILFNLIYIWNLTLFFLHYQFNFLHSPDLKSNLLHYSVYQIILFEEIILIYLQFFLFFLHFYLTILQNSHFSIFQFSSLRRSLRSNLLSSNDKVSCCYSPDTYNQEKIWKISIFHLRKIFHANLEETPQLWYLFS